MRYASGLSCAAAQTCSTLTVEPLAERFDVRTQPTFLVPVALASDATARVVPATRPNRSTVRVESDVAGIGVRR